MGVDIRPGVVADAPAAAAIVNDWIDGQDWMPRLHSSDAVEVYYREVVFTTRLVWVIGDPVAGFLALDPEASLVSALYVAKPGLGMGRALLDHAKADRTALELWTFQANAGARRFYAREGFHEVEFTEGDNEEGLPDVRLTWNCHPIRKAGPEDAATCARIVSDWVKGTDWIAARFSEEALAQMIEEAMPMREIFLIGEPVAGYLSLNPETGHIGALYVDRPGAGLGKALLDRAKSRRDLLRLNTHAPNRAAHRFYDREGFKVVGELPMGDDGLPELQMEWRR